MNCRTGVQIICSLYIVENCGCQAAIRGGEGASESLLPHSPTRLVHVHHSFYDSPQENTKINIEEIRTVN